MKVEFLRDSEQTEPKLVVVAAEESERVQKLVSELERAYCNVVKGYEGDRVCLIAQSDILRVYAEGSRVFCQTEDGVYTLHARLYEMEEFLEKQNFVRISKCELINKQKILRLDVSLTGTVGIMLEGNVKTYTSRRYVSKIKSIFEI